MGKLKWAAYQPEDINWEARSRVEAWSRHDRDIKTRITKRKSTHTGSGFLFLLAMVSLLTVTYWKFF